jgi:hypothetical protein
VSIIVDALAAWGALSIACCSFVVWCGIAVGRDRRRNSEAQDDEAIAVTREPSDAEIQQMVRKYYREGGNRG